MRQFLTATFLTITAIGAAIASADDLNVNGESPALCNCTELVPEVQACHSATLELEVGSSIVKVKTGYSSSVCVTVDLPPATCVFYRYNYECEDVGTFFTTWKCKLISASIQTRATTDADCNDDAK